MVAEVYGALGAFKAMFDMARGLKDINDAAIRNAAVIELQEQILTAQQSQTALLERVNELEQQLARFETWESEKQRYKLVQVGDGAFAYVIKPEAQSSDPEYLICPTCYEQRQKQVLQALPKAEQRGPNGDVRTCPKCHTKVAVARNPDWKPQPDRRW